MAPDFDRLARTPWPIACCASSGTRLFNSVLARSCSRYSGKDGGKLRPSIRRGHVDDTGCLDPGLRRIDTEKGRDLSAFDTTPELAFGRDDKVLVEGIGMSLDLDPLAAAGNDRKHRRPG